MSKYDEDLKKACEILNNTELDELVQVAVEAMDDAATDIGMEASQEWHAKITLESALIHIAEKVAKRPQLTIPKSIAESVEKHHKDFQGRGYFEEIVLAWLWETKPDNENLDFYEERFHIIQAYLAGKALCVSCSGISGY